MDDTTVAGHDVKYGIDSRLFESGWDFEEWCRLADPAYHALCALLDMTCPR